MLLRVTDIGEVSWTSVSDLDAPRVLSYELEYEGGHCNTTELMSYSAPTQVAVLELESGSYYTLRVRAINVFANGSWSGVVEHHTPRSRKFEGDLQ